MSEQTATILVVDDTDTMRYVVSSWLRRAGFAAFVAPRASARLNGRRAAGRRRGGSAGITRNFVEQ